MSHAGWPRRGHAALPAALVLAWSVVGCITDAPATDRPAPETQPSPGTAAPPTRTPSPSSPTAFDVQRVEGTFPDLIALTSTGEELYWASGAAVWRFAPGDAVATKLYENQAGGALAWDVAASGGAAIISEGLPNPAGAWRLLYLADGDAPLELDAGIAEHGRPPTVAIDGEHIAWAGFDEASGSPRSFLRFASADDPTSATTVIDETIDDRLLWYPELDGDTLWYSSIDPDFEGTGVGDETHIETIDLAVAAAAPVRFHGAGLDFDVAVSPDHIVWKSVEPGFSALTWGELHLLDRRSGEQLEIATQADRPSVGARFVAFEELFHRRLLLYDLATRSVLEVPDARLGGRGTIGIPAVAGNLLAYSVAARGQQTVYWTLLPA